MLEFGLVEARWTDLLRLVAVPAFAWAAWRDVRIRRVSNALWPPLAGIGIVLLFVDALHYWGLGGLAWQRFMVATVISVGFLFPMAYGFWRLGAFGGADAKALMALAVLFPFFPRYWVGSTLFPVVETTAGSFAFTILTNAVLLGLCYPIALAAYNLASGDVSKAMVVGRRLHWSKLPTAHGRLLERPDGFSRSGLDLDALRMYLRWRDSDLADVRERPDELRDPSSLPEEPNPPTDGAVVPGDEATITDGGTATTEGKQSRDGGSIDDPWGAEAFLDAIEGNAYGTDPDDLRDGLELVAAREVVWISPGIPFLVPIFAGLVVGVVYGDVLFGVLGWLGIV